MTNGSTLAYSHTNARLTHDIKRPHTNWYNTPSKIHKWFPMVSNLCWRCGEAEGSAYHIWWDCDLIRPFWQKVCEIIKQITETSILLTTVCCLLHISKGTMKRYKRSLTKFLLTAAKVLIPRYWKTTKIPTIKRVASQHT